MAKQNYRCAGCGIRTDPGKALSSPMPVRGNLQEVTTDTEGRPRQELAVVGSYSSEGAVLHQNRSLG